MSVLALVVRGLFTLAFLWMILRISGRRDWRTVSALDLVAAIILGNLGDALILGRASLQEGVIGIGVIAWLHVLGIHLARRSQQWKHWLHGRPMTLIRDGRMLSPAMQLTRINQSQLMMLLHECGVERLHDVKELQLDADGALILHTVHDHEPMTRHDLAVLRAHAQENPPWKRAA